MCSFSLTGEFLSVLFMEWPLNGTRCIHSRQSVNDDGMNERKPSISLPELAVDCHQQQWSVLVCHILGSPRNSHFLKLSTVWWYRRAVLLGISFDFPGSCCCPIPFHVYWPFVVLL